MISKEAQRALISWEPINSRLISAKFRSNHERIGELFAEMCPNNGLVIGGSLLMPHKRVHKAT